MTEHEILSQLVKTVLPALAGRIKALEEANLVSLTDACATSIKSLRDKVEVIDQYTSKTKEDLMHELEVIQNEIQDMWKYLHDCKKEVEAVKAQPVEEVVVKKRGRKKSVQEPATAPIEPEPEATITEPANEPEIDSQASQTQTGAELSDPLDLTPMELEMCEQLFSLGITDAAQVARVYGISQEQYTRFLETKNA